MAAPRIAPPGRPRGFTLIELLVVLLLLAAVAALVPPFLGRGETTAELNGAARELAAALRYARSDAITHRREAVVVLDVRQRRYQVSGRPGMRRLPGGLEYALVTARTELADDAVGAIRFYPDGSSTGGRVTVWSGDRGREVAVQWLTGVVEVENVERS